MEISLSGYFIGTVKDYDTVTRKVAVYLPKLMPGITEDQDDIDTMTNYGMHGTDNLQLRPTISTKSYIWVSSADSRTKLPDVGSHVCVIFLDERIDMGYWLPFNPSGDFNVIPAEKYDKLHKLKIGNSTVDIDTEDEIQINLPDGYRTTTTTEGKVKTINVIPGETGMTAEYVNSRIGNPTCVETNYGNGTVTTNTIEATGLFKRIENIEDFIGNETETEYVQARVVNTDKILTDDIYIYDSETNSFVNVPVDTPIVEGQTYYIKNTKQASGLLQVIELINNALGFENSGLTGDVRTLQAKIPDPPTTAGNYVLKCTVDDSGNKAYTWVTQ